MMRELLYRNVNEKAFSGGIRKRLFFTGSVNMIHAADKERKCHEILAHRTGNG